MSYMLTKRARIRLPATRHSLRYCIRHSLEFAQEHNVSSLAIPVMAARPTYGLGAKASYHILRDELKHTKIPRVYICFDNKISERFGKERRLL